MDTVLELLSILCVIAAVVLFILFIVRWIRKKRKLWFGLSSLFCLICAVILAVVGSQLWLHNMTPEERAAYEQRLEQEAEERRLAEEAAASQQAKAESEAAESQRLKEESEAAASSARVASEKDVYKRQALDIAIAALRNGWISVEDRLPEDDLPKDSDRLMIKCLVAAKGKNGIRTLCRQRYVMSFDPKVNKIHCTDWFWSKGRCV